MDSIQAVREAIESLSTDEKIDEGQYLALMNHLKTVYQKLERSERKEERIEFVVSGNGGGNGGMGNVMEYIEEMLMLEDEQKEDIPRPVIHRRVVGLGWRDARDDLFILPNDYFPVDGEEIKVALVMLRNAIRNHWNDVRDFQHHTLADIPQMFIRWILRGGVGIWRDLEVREIFLSHATVRRLNLERVLERRRTSRKAHYTLGGTDDDWALLLKDAHLPFYTKRRVNKKGECVDVEAKTLQKLHPITLTLRFTPTMGMEVELYTDKIQLGRSDIIPTLSQIMIEIVRVEGWNDVPLEKLIKYAGWGLIKSSSEMKREYPKMKVSGITAHTREKKREYDCANGLITITYREKYAK